jgi:hypothetical protein
MAKKNSGKPNKSSAIREILTQNPHTPVNEIIKALGTKGMKVQPSLIYFVKGKMKRRKRRQIGQRMEKAGFASPVDLILKVRKLAGEAGGMTKLKQLVDALAE